MEQLGTKLSLTSIKSELTALLKANCSSRPDSWASIIFFPASPPPRGASPAATVTSLLKRLPSASVSNCRLHTVEYNVLNDYEERSRRSCP